MRTKSPAFEGRWYLKSGQRPLCSKLQGDALSPEGSRDPTASGASWSLFMQHSSDLMLTPRNVLSREACFLSERSEEFRCGRKAHVSWRERTSENEHCFLSFYSSPIKGVHDVNQLKLCCRLHPHPIDSQSLDKYEFSFFLWVIKVTICCDLIIYPGMPFL